MLFYMQHSGSSNTVVYQARLNAERQFDPARPVEVYWRVCQENGRRAPLSFLERNFAYGIEWHPAKGHENALLANRERKAVIDVDRNGNALALLSMGHRQTKLIYAYVDVDNSGLLPSINYADLFGTDITNGKIINERIWLASMAREKTSLLKRSAMR